MERKPRLPLRPFRALIVKASTDYLLSLRESSRFRHALSAMQEQPLNSRKYPVRRSVVHPKPTPVAGINCQILSTIVMSPYEPTSRSPTIW